MNLEKQPKQDDKSSVSLKDHPILAKIHYFITTKMSRSGIVNNYLIVTVTDETGEIYDCIYCTILRNSVLFACIGFILGFIFAWLVWLSI